MPCVLVESGRIGLTPLSQYTSLTYVSCVLVESGRIGLTPLSQYTSLTYICALGLVSWYTCDLRLASLTYLS